MNDRINAQQYDLGPVATFVLGAVSVTCVAGALSGLCLVLGKAGCAITAAALVAIAGVMKP